MSFSAHSSEALQRKAQVERLLTQGDNALLEYIERRHIPGISIAVIHNYKIEWAAGYGFRESGQPATVDTETLFQACSMSKAVTAIAALRLVEQGKLALDGDINDVLTSWKLRSQGRWQPRVTLRQLLSHRAGTSVAWYPGYHREQDIPTLHEILDGEQPSNTSGVQVTGIQGIRFRYSGGGYSVVQQALMDVTGKPFPVLMHDLIFAPLDMRRSTYEQPLPTERWQNIASAHRAGGKPVPGQWHVYPEMAAAGLWTTPSDYARFALDLQRTKAGLDGRLLSAKMGQELLTPQATARDGKEIGLGVFLQGRGQGARFGHGGDNTGFQCTWVSLENGGQGYVIMTNSDEGWRVIEKLERVIAEVYEWPPVPATLRRDNEQEQAVYEEYTGEYVLQGNVSLNITKSEDELLFHVPGQEPIILEPLDDMVFLLTNLEDTITFLRNEQGNVDMLIVRQDASEIVARKLG